MSIKYSEKIKQLHNEGKISFEQAKLIFEASQKTDKNEKLFLEQVLSQKHKRERSLWGVLIVWTILLVFSLSVLIFSGSAEKMDVPTKKALQEIEFANFYLMRGDYEGAINQYKNCLENYPKFELAKVLLGVSYKMSYLETKEDKFLGEYTDIFQKSLLSMTQDKNQMGFGKKNVLFAFIFVVLLVSAFKLASIFVYMVLVNKERKINKLWSQVSLCMQRKIDLVPALIEGIKDRVGHEQGELKTVLVACVQGKDSLGNIGGLALESSEELKKVIGDKSSIIYGFKSLDLFLDKFPQLQSEKQVVVLQEQIRLLEKSMYKIIDKYNIRVQRYNALISKKPFDFLVNNFGFYKKAVIQWR